MIKVNILNLNGFLETVNQCSGSVMILCPNGNNMDITRQYLVQKELEKQYEKNGKCLPLTLSFEKPNDFMADVSYYAGDC